ncbi:MAG: hypothetical protein HOV68_22850 [Streptomycetaceae bacterium]|nr:hypothetical protein [Streptomycetaceae bacterium]
MIRRSLSAIVLGALLAAGCADESGDLDRDDVPTPVGLDLADVVLTPQRPLGKGELQRAADTIRKRAEALGLRVEFTEPRDGAVALRVSVRGLGLAAEERVAQLGRSATVDLRPVLAMAGLPSGAVYEGAVPPDARPAFDALACAGTPVDPPAKPPDPPQSTTVACDPDGDRKYALAPVALDGGDIRRADAVYPTSAEDSVGGWHVELHLTAEGAHDFRELTSRLQSGRDYPTGSLAVVWRGVVISAPNAAALTEDGRVVVVSGNFTERTADELAGIITAGTLPVAFTVTSYVHTS